MKKLFLLFTLAFVAMSCEMIDEKLDDFIGRDDSSVTTIANNQIWYTSTDGEIVEPYSGVDNNYADALTTFGVNIVSNTYVDGKGVIEFDGDVTIIGDYAFYYCSSLTSVTIPDSVTTIGEGAFAICGNLTSVIIPDSVTTIGESAFDSCSSLTSVTIPDSVTTIGDGAFNYCSSLKEFNGKFASGDGRCLIVNGELNAFARADITEYTIPDSVTSIGISVFGGCGNLTSITIPNSVTTIGDNAFYDCSSLTSVTIPDSVTTIGDRAFDGCSRLTSVYCKAITPPAGVSNMFYDNALGRKIYVPMESVEAYKSAEGWSEYAFDIVCYDFENGVAVTPKPANNEILYTNGSTTEATTPNETNAFGANIVSNTYDAAKWCWVIKFDGEVTSIGDCAFPGCESLTSVTIPDSVTTIGEDAFLCCSSLTSVNIPDSVTTIGVGAFSSCESLTSVNIPDSVTTIGDHAFLCCRSLTSITIPDSVTSIGYEAFRDCSSLQEFNGKFASEDGRCLIIDGTLNSFAPAGLTEYTIPDSVTTIGEWAFSSCDSLTSVTIPDSVTTIGEWAFYLCTSLTSVTIPNSVTSIGDDAFYLCESLTSVTIPDSVTTIGGQAFCRCESLQEFKSKFASEDGRCLIIDGTLNAFAPAGLTEYTIPDSVTTIGEDAFLCCDSLTSVTIGDSVTTIGEWAFYSCSSLTSVTIPDSVTEIGDYAFDWCHSLTSVTIPDSVTTIGDDAFQNCWSLTSVYCKPTTPPAGGVYMFSDNASGRKIYVPMESVEAYKSASYWSDYADDIVGYNF